MIQKIRLILIIWFIDVIRIRCYIRIILKDGDINPKEVFKNQARFKSDLREIKIGGKKSVNQKIQYYYPF